MKSVEPEEARRALLQGLRHLAVTPSRELRSVRAEDEQPRLALAHELEERDQRTRAAQAKALDPHTEAHGKRARPAQRRFDVLALHVIQTGERDGDERGRDCVDGSVDPTMGCARSR